MFVCVEIYYFVAFGVTFFFFKILETFVDSIVKKFSETGKRATTICVNSISQCARQAAMRVVLDESGADAYLEVPPGNTMTLSQEITDQQVALFNWTLKARFEPIRRLTTAMLSPVDEPR